jgi:aspartyl-tRNA(Asn)/glutamyl-tRNA(Gln) amidotransferase subunit A
MTASMESLAAAAQAIRTRALSPVELVRACLARIEARSDLNAFVTVLADHALADARRAEESIAHGRYLGPLHGIPVSIKDLVDVAGTKTTSGSALPAHEAACDAPIVRRLCAAGAIIIGKTNLHEFAFGTTSDETAFGPVRNPHDASRSAGGSSGGAAAALVEGMCLGSIGTDTGGSIRIPAAACGIVGLKPTLGELPVAGIVPLSATLDHVGPMARTVADAGLMFRALEGGRVEAPAAATGRLRFGIPRAYFCEPLDPGVNTALDRAAAMLRDAGHDVLDLHIDDAAWTPDVYLHISLPEAAWYHAPMLERFADRYTPGVRLRIEMGRYVTAEDYVRAMRLRDVLRASVTHALGTCDALLLPALAIPAPPIGATTVDVDLTAATRAPVRATMLKLTQLFNLTGHPAIAIPAGQGSDGLPRGLQLVGHRGETWRLLEIAKSAEAHIAAGPGSVGGGTG